MWAAAGSGASNDFRTAVAVVVHRADRHTALERRVVRIEARHFREGREIQHADVRTAARASARDDVRAPVAVQIAGCDGYAAGKARVVCVEAGQYRQIYAVEHPNVRTAASARARDDVGASVAIHVAGGDEDPAG